MESITHTIRSIRTATAVLVVMALPTLIWAASPYRSDYINLGLNAGYSTLVGRYSGMDVSGGFSGGIHFGYEYRVGNFWLGANGEFQYLSSNCQSDISVGSVNFQDTRETNAVMNYEMLSRLDESQNFGIANLTFMAGYQQGLQRKYGFYCGAGAKLGCKFDIRNTTSLSYRTYATYDEYIDPYKGMDNHYYTSYDKKGTVSFGTKLNVSLTAEAGCDIKLEHCNRMKLGMFVDAGVTNIMKDVPTHEPRVNPDNVTDIITYSAYNREAMSTKYIIPIVVGFKFSILFNISNAGRRCASCPCYRNR